MIKENWLGIVISDSIFIAVHMKEVSREIGFAVNSSLCNLKNQGGMNSFILVGWITVNLDMKAIFEEIEVLFGL